MQLIRLPRAVTPLLVTSVAALMAFADFVPAAQPDSPPAAPRPPIPVRFRLTEAAYVTLVIERLPPAAPDDTSKKGLRVKNLISNTWYPAGEHTVWWDGLEETNTRMFLIPGETLFYRIDGSLMSPGEYRVRGLVRQAMTPKYEFAVYSGDHSPPWKTKSGRGGWLADHTPPAAAEFLPGSKVDEKVAAPCVLLSCPVSEAGDGRLWVAEHWLVPKRVSIWAPEGRLVKAMYGPTWYGGGGSLNPRDRTGFFVHGDGGGMEFKLDWERGTSELKQVYYLPGQTGMTPPTRHWKSFPQTPVWAGERLYLSNCFAGGPTNGEATVSLWHYRDGLAVAVASLGDTATWDLLKTEPFQSRWPAGVKPAPDEKSGNATFAWCDLNDDAQAQPDEVQNGNRGNVYLFTTDGMLVATLFQDVKTTKPWPEEERRGAELGHVSLSDECFFPSIQQMADGRVYLIAGKSFSGIFEITGLDTIRRWPEQRLTITAEHVAAARRYLDARPPEPPDPREVQERKAPEEAPRKKQTEKDPK